jgi:hypothetical protein
VEIKSIGFEGKIWPRGCFGMDELRHRNVEGIRRNGGGGKAKRQAFGHSLDLFYPPLERPTKNYKYKGWRE